MATIPDVHPQPARFSLRSFRLVRAGGNFDEIVKSAREGLTQHPGHPVVLRALARLLWEHGQTQESLKCWTILHEADVSDAEASYRLAESWVRQGFEPRSAISKVVPETHVKLGSALESVLCGERFGARDSFHHVAICGVSFCGSTIIDRILGSLPGVRSIGESHWLTKENNGKKLCSDQFE